MKEDSQLRPFGDDSYRIMITDAANDKLAIFVAINIELTNVYLAEAEKRMSEAGYPLNENSLAQEIALAFYAEVCGEEETPRAVFWQDDTKEDKLKKFRDVICYQKWGKTPNQYPRWTRFCLDFIQVL